MNIYCIELFLEARFGDDAFDHVQRRFLIGRDVLRSSQATFDYEFIL